MMWNELITDLINSHLKPLGLSCAGLSISIVDEDLVKESVIDYLKKQPITLKGAAGTSSESSILSYKDLVFFEIELLEKESKDESASLEGILENMVVKYGVGEGRTLQTLDKMVQRGLIYESSKDYYKTLK